VEHLKAIPNYLVPGGNFMPICDQIMYDDNSNMLGQASVGRGSSQVYVAIQ
jgi:hypothetical protein